MNTNDFIDALEHELRLASRRRVRLELARMPRPGAGVVALAVALVVCAGVAVPLLATRSSTTAGSPGQGSPPSSQPSGHVVLGCAHTVYGQLSRNWRSPGAGTVSAGPIAWAYLARSFNPASAKESHFIKAVAVVSPGETVTVSIPRSEAGRVSLDYAGVAPRSPFSLPTAPRSVTFRPCPRSRWPGGLSEFVGGFFISGPQCAQVDIVAGGRHGSSGTLTLGHAYLPLGRSCPIHANERVRRMLAGNGIGRAVFGDDPKTVVRRIDALLGQPPSRPYHRTSTCRADHTIYWPALLALFHHGRFVGYVYEGGQGSGPFLATLKGLQVGDPLMRGKHLYGSALHVSAAQGGSWSAKTPHGAIFGYTTGVTNPPGDVKTIEAGYVGCPALTP